jgi:hypothetical protein
MEVGTGPGCYCWFLGHAAMEYVRHRRPLKVMC